MIEYRDPITGYMIRRYTEGPERNAKLYFTTENFTPDDRFFFFNKQQLEGRDDGGCYLGTIGGVAAVLSASSIKSIECVEWPELGMEAVYKIEVVDFPAFILVDDKGNDFFKQLKPRNEIKCECCKK